jgi:multidrug efflux pump subunit AcrA (membrane-fusion protein)
MRRPDVRIAAALIVVGVGLGGCSGSSADRSPNPAVKVEHAPGNPLVRVVLTRAADERLGIATAASTRGPGRRVSIPYAALLYDPDGRTTTFTRVAPFTYVRRPVTVAAIRGDRVILSGGIPAGLTVVVVGADELLGAETGVQGE